MAIIFGLLAGWFVPGVFTTMYFIYKGTYDLKILTNAFLLGLFGFVVFAIIGIEIIIDMDNNDNC